MKVAYQSTIKNAYEFTDKTKDGIYFIVSGVYGASPIAVFDDNGKPALKLRVYYSKDKFKERTIHIGDYVILNNDETKILEILQADEFHNKYTCLE